MTTTPRAPLRAKLCVAPHPVLGKRAVKVKRFDEHLHKILAEMGATLLKTGGVGIAAPQVGAQIRACILAYEGEALTLVNPEIVWRSSETDTQSEACLSLPRKVYREVTRAQAVRVRYQDLHGARHTRLFEGMLARIAQHECDHLAGVLVAERVTRAQIVTLPPGTRLRKDTPDTTTEQEATNPE